MSLMIISCLFDCFIVEAPVLYSNPAAPAQYVSSTEMSVAQLRHDNSLTDSDSLSETSLHLGVFLDLVITVTTRAKVRVTREWWK